MDARLAMTGGGEPGTVFWFTGLSGAGKTTLARLFSDELRRSRPAVVFLDGDSLREVFGEDLGYDPPDRLRSALRNARLCRLLSSQGLDVVCATISLFHACHAWNRQHLPRYREIHVRAPLEVLVQRDSKGLYRRALAGEMRGVVGVDLPAEEPLRPDAKVLNDGSVPPHRIVRDLLARLVPEDASPAQRRCGP